MRTINKNRAVMLHSITKKAETEADREDAMIENMNDFYCQFDVNSMALKLLRDTYSYIENSECKQCSIKSTKNFPVITTGLTLKPNFDNFVGSIHTNFPESLCIVCKNRMNVTREFGNLLFIEVIE